MRKLFFCLFVALIAVTFAVPAFAQAKRDVSFYGDVRMISFWHKDAKETNNLPATWSLNTTQLSANAARAQSLNFSDSDMEFGTDVTTSRFGVRVTDGDVSFNIELRPKNDGDVRIRHWYGAWNFGVGSLILGQTWAPDAYGAITSCCQGGGAMGYYGDLGGSSRVPQIALWFPLKEIGGTLRIAALQPYLGGYTGAGGNVATTVVTAANGAAAPATDIDQTLPKLVAGIDFTFGPLNIYLTAGWQSYDEVVAATDKEYSIDSYYYGITAKFSMGPITLKANTYQTQNGYEYGFGINGTGWGATYNPATDAIIDADHWGYAMAAAYKLSDMITFEIGYVGMKGELDWPGRNSYVDKSRGYYLTVPIQIAKNVWIEPEIGKFDYKDRVTNGVSVDEGDTVYWGAYWRIAF